jgi:hypothetical protein
MKATLHQLAKEALPLEDIEWDSERQIGAENRFFIEAEKILSESDFQRLEEYCAKATTEKESDLRLP